MLLLNFGSTDIGRNILYFYNLFYSITYGAVKKIETDALSQWKDGFLKATSKVIAIAFDGQTG